MTTHATPSAAAGGSAADGAAVLMVCSSGGHLAQLITLEPWWRRQNTRWVTFDTTDARSLLAEEDVVWAYHPTTRNIPNLLRNAWLAVRTIRQHRPEIVISTGAGVALPFFVLAKLMGIPTAYIEVFDRIDSSTLTGRLCRPFTTSMLVQWDEQQPLYKGSVVVGPLL